MFFQKRKREKVFNKMINGLILKEQLCVNDKAFFLTLEETTEDYADQYIWNYIQRDIICSVLESYVTYAYTSDEENLEILKSAIGGAETYKATNDGATLFHCEHLRAISARIIEEYWDVWECGGPSYISFIAYDKEVHTDGKDKKEEYIVKIKPLGDNDGLEIFINEKKYSKDKLTSSIMLVLEQYGLHLLTM
ncbi:MAG: hypothetical protein J6J38_08595 [Lachnospiraceae bacterium]|nr:hypothetical protein [Lachnospiraceae bacterium]